MTDVCMLYHKKGAVSAPRLAAYLGIEASSDPGFMAEKPDYLIRWGSKSRVPYTPKERTLNRRRMLVRYSNRLEELQRLQLAGVRVPPFGDNPIDVLSQGVSAVLARTFGSNGQTSGGKGITYFSMEKGTALPAEASEETSWDFFTGYIPKDRQFRVHVVGGDTRTRELIPNEPDAAAKPVWNYGNGFTFKYPKGKDIPLQVVPAAVQATKALWLDFGAVDVVTYQDVAYVLEVNTAPGLADPTLEWYGGKIASMVGLSEFPGWDADGLEKENES